MSTTAFIYSVAAGAMGVVISLTYRKTGRVSVNFARMLIVLPILVCVVMQAVNGSLGTSVAILGAFSLIRFRSLQGSSRDIAFVFFAMTTGIICSIGYLLFAAGITAMVCVIFLILEFTHYAQKRTQPKDLRVTIPENLDYTEIFDDIFENYLKKWELIRVKTTNMGSLYELEYQVELKDASQEKQMIDDIRVRNGNLNIVCGRCELEYEQL